MATSFELALTFQTITCCVKGCGLTFAVPDTWVEKRRVDHSWWHCPNGHHQYFPGKSDAEKLRDELARTQKRLESERRCCVSYRETAHHLERRINGYKGALASQKKRLA
ncbi:MAG TPA: hypothetical protein VML95_09510 [Longimicrobiales bacterium]|nr:hypothetical protein [Longimicrobiales bacterium]